jgi:hypothetical protein
VESLRRDVLGFRNYAFARAAPGFQGFFERGQFVLFRHE